MKHRNKHRAYSLTPILLFTCFVLFLFLVSLVLRAVNLIKTSKFDGSHSFYVEILGPEGLSKGFELIEFAPDKQTVSLLEVNPRKGFHINGSVQETFGIPIDAKVIFNNKDDYNNFVKIANNKIESKILYVLSKNNYKHIDLTFIDLIRLWIYAFGVNVNNISAKQIQLSSSQSAIDQIDSTLFTDYTLYNDRKNIEVINDTNVTGLASRMARLITNMGGNVIMLSSQTDTLGKTSAISYFGKRTYTIDRLSNLLGFSVKKMSKPGIADIIIDIGQDSADSSNF